MITEKEGAGLRSALWENCKDSIEHAFDHLSELRSRRAERRHHSKWALLSAHHAAECFASILVLEHAPCELRRRDAAVWFPSLARSIEILRRPADPASLQGAEKRLLLLMDELLSIRHQLAHKGLPPELEASIAGIVTLGLLHVARRRGLSFDEEAQGQFVQLREGAFHAIKYQRVEEYCRLAEVLYHEERGTEGLSWCAACETLSVSGDICEVCFAEVDLGECPNCGEGVAVSRWMRGEESGPVDCPACDAAVPPPA